MRETGFQSFPNQAGDIFRGCDLPFQEIDIEVEVFMIESGDNLLLHDRLQILEIDDHAGFGIDLAGHRHLEGIIMPVKMGSGALAEYAAIFLPGEIRGKKPVRCAELEFFTDDEQTQAPNNKDIYYY